MKTLNLSFIRGDTVRLPLKVRIDGNPANITNWTVFFTLKSSPDDSDEKAIIKKDINEHVDPENGETEVVLSQEETGSLLGSYHYDIQVKDDNGDISTPVRGIMTFSADITRRTS